MWMTHPSCSNVVQQAWSIHTVGSRAFQQENKLSNVRRDFITWNKEVFGKVEQEIHLKQAQLQQMQNSIYTVEDVRKEKLVRADLETLMHKEDIMWAQKARDNQVIYGDRNTKYFETVMKQRRARNQIIQLKPDAGEIINDQKGNE